VNLHGPVRAAEVEGTARIVISLSAWTEGKVQPSVHEITVRAAKKGRKTEPVTDRLVKTLPHPDRKANIGAVRFSPDGSRFMMTGYPSGVVQLWDARAWKETARLETPSGLRSSWGYALPSPDWKSILVYQMSRKLVREEKDGKVKERLQVDGRIDLYDATTGKRTRSIPLADRGPQELFLVPGGKSVLVNTQWSFSTAVERPQATELIDLATGTAKKLFDTICQPAFAPDGKTAYFVTTKYKQSGEFENALVKYDLVKGRVLKTKDKKDKETYFARPSLSPDGKYLFVITGRMVKFRTEDSALAVLDSETLAELGRIPGQVKEDSGVTFDEPRFTPDGKTLITRCGGPLIVWDLEKRKTVRTVPVGDLPIGRLLLGPDGKRAVLAGMPKFDLRRVILSAPDPEDLPQPRLLVIDLADPKSKPQVLMLPAGMLGGAAYSPDGKMVAVGGAGGAHLIDVSARPKK
jgi:WD40 repeat protein